MKTYLTFFIVFILLPIHTCSASNDLFLLFSGEETGNLEPCGCFEGQIGGISRRYTFIDSFTKQKKSIFSVSLGDLPKSSGRQEEIKMEFLHRALGEMGYALHNIGEKDIEIGSQLISYLSQTSKVVFLSSNVEIVSSFPTKIHQYVLKEFSNPPHQVKIAFLGILSKSLINASVIDNVTVYEPAKALKPLVDKLKNKVNLIVLLSHASPEESMEIAQLFPEIGLIITGHDIDEPMDSIKYVNDTPIVSPGKGGKYIGVARYSMKNKDLNRVSVEVLPLDKKYKDAHEMALLLKEYQQTVIGEDLLSKIPQVSLPDELSFVGSSACGICHKIVHDHWSKTTHGISYSTLVGTGQQYDPECIKCHTTGYGYVSGFLNYEENPNLINVGCESCHGAGSEHIKNVNNPYGLTDENNCLTCHDSEHSPKFQFNEYWQKIDHTEEVLIGKK